MATVRENDTLVYIKEDGRYYWLFEPPRLNELKAEIFAIETVQKIHLEGLAKAEGDRRKRLRKIVSYNWQELDRLIAEYYELQRKFQDNAVQLTKDI